MTARPTVLHCVRDFVRPSETFVLDLVRRTRATRSVVACGVRNPAVVDRAALRGTGVRVWPVGRLAPHPERPRDRRILRGLLAAVVAAERADLLHAHFGYWGAHTARTAARVRRPWVLSLHGHDLLVEDRDNPEAAALRRADAVVVPSAFLAAAAAAAGFPSERVHVLPSGVDLARLPFRERTPGPGGAVTVLFAGRFVAKKGAVDAVEALAEVVRARPQVRALFVGYGPQEQEIRDRAAERGLPLEIRPGDAPGAVRTALDEAHLVVMPSRTAPDGDAETLGLVAIEAQACGVPVVATRHGGLVDAVDAAAGAFVDEGDVGALAAAVSALVGHPDRWPAMARAGRRHVESRFEIGVRVAAVEALYADLIRSPRGRR